MEIYTRQDWEDMMTEVNKPQSSILTVEYIETRLKKLKEAFDNLVDKIPAEDELTIRAAGRASTQIGIIRHLLLTIAKEGFHPYAHLQ